MASWPGTPSERSEPSERARDHEGHGGHRRTSGRAPGASGIPPVLRLVCGRTAALAVQAALYPRLQDSDLCVGWIDPTRHDGMRRLIEGRNTQKLRPKRIYSRRAVAWPAVKTFHTIDSRWLATSGTPRSVRSIAVMGPRPFCRLQDASAAGSETTAPRERRRRRLGVAAQAASADRLQAWRRTRPNGEIGVN